MKLLSYKPLLLPLAAVLVTLAGHENSADNKPNDLGSKKGFWSEDIGRQLSKIPHIKTFLERAAEEEQLIFAALKNGEIYEDDAYWLADQVKYMFELEEEARKKAIGQRFGERVDYRYDLKTTFLAKLKYVKEMTEKLFEAGVLKEEDQELFRSKLNYRVIYQENYGVLEMGSLSNPIYEREYWSQLQNWQNTENRLELLYGFASDGQADQAKQIISEILDAPEMTNITDIERTLIEIFQKLDQELKKP